MLNKKTDIQIAKTDAKLDKVAKMLGGLGQNQGDIAEDFFYNSFVKENTLGNLTFDDMTKNMQKRHGRLEEEYDLFLTNGESMPILMTLLNWRVNLTISNNCSPFTNIINCMVQWLLFVLIAIQNKHY